MKSMSLDEKNKYFLRIYSPISRESFRKSELKITFILILIVCTQKCCRKCSVKIFPKVSISEPT